MKTRGIIAVAALFVFTFCSLGLMAQAGPPPPPGSGAPIDGGLAALVAGAAVMGYRAMREKTGK